MPTVGAAEPVGSSRAEGPTGAKIGVTLCCAYSDLAVMQRLEALLREEGIVVELLPGIERDTNALQLQLASDDGPTIYVLANSKGIDANCLEQLVQMFGAQRGPAHRLLVLDVDAEDPSRMVLPVVRAHAAMRKHRSSGELPRRSTQRGLPTASPARKTPSATPRAERDDTQREVQPFALGIDAVDAGGGEVDVRRPGRASDDRYAFGIDLPSTQTERSSSTEYGREATRGGREVIQLPSARRRTSKEHPRASEPPSRRPTPVATSSPQRKPSPTPIGPRRKATPQEIGVVVEVGPTHDERRPTDTPRPPARRNLDPKSGREARETARDLEAQRETPIPKATPTAKARKPATLWLAIGGLAIAAAVAIFALGPSDEGAVVEQRGLAASAVGKVDGTPAPKPAKSEAAPPPEADVKEPEAKQVPAKPRAVPRLNPVDEAKRIAAAVDARRIHALDALLFVAPDDRHAPVDWATATGRCEGADVDGIAGWRLPTVAEARKLRGARRLRPGRYWTDAPAGETVPVVSSSGGRPAALAKSEQASAICVRKRIGG